MSYLFDTDTCISLLDSREPEKRKNILARLERLSGPAPFLSVVTVFELVFGVENSQFKKTNHAALDTFLLDFRVVPLDELAAREAGRIRAALERRGERIGSMDTLIAAHAKALGLTVVTGNLAHFSRVKGLKVEDWAA